ncbi:ATP-grasp domain-containing protein [Pseudomonas rubra]|uniref:Biotin carboxylase n=1 Tax=Pseudomonas rubra TaxID=2942627 RepID=A0ABT5P3K7_9PSED|nr:biotin carboxylase [Pseudomonas rubra]MDD1012875.1 biotin carboxylase [Pseudomonas rubra]MDD1038257.1 biotin carboxylase [Pseudomonas rubra]MDD1156664.1 biotin carboxylase [Pseudomonas rubra]
MNPVILFCPVKILLQHSEQEWLNVLGNHSLIYSDIAGKTALHQQFPTLIESFRLYPDFNESALVEIDALAAARALGTHTVIALAEVDLLRVARIKDRLNGLRTRHEAMTLLYRDKFLMKQKLAAHGIRINPMAVVGSACEINDFIERYGYPVVVKPRDGRGSGGVRVLRDIYNLRDYLQQQDGTTLHNLMVEKYLDAPLLNVNGLYIDGNPVIISPVRSTVTCLDFLDGQSLGFQMLAQSNPLHAQSVKLTRRIIEQALPNLGNLLFHLEVFLDGDDLIVCEIACRLGGCSVNQELTLAYGLNPRLTLIDAERGGKSASLKSLLPQRHLLGQLNVPPRTGKLIDFPTSIDLPFIRYCSVTAQKGADYSGMRMTNGEIVSAIVEGNSEKEVSDHLMQLDSWVRDTFIWS